MYLRGCAVLTGTFEPQTTEKFECTLKVLLEAIPFVVKTCEVVLCDSVTTCYTLLRVFNARLELELCHVTIEL